MFQSLMPAKFKSGGGCDNLIGRGGHKRLLYMVNMPVTCHEVHLPDVSFGPISFTL